MSENIIRCPFCDGLVEVGSYMFVENYFPYRCLYCHAYFRLMAEDETIELKNREDYDYAGAKLFKKHIAMKGQGWKITLGKDSCIGTN